MQFDGLTSAFKSFARSQSGRIATAFLAVFLASCGGGGSGGAGGGGGIAPMVDSFGKTMPSSFDGDSANAEGADGGAGDGAPIPNAPVILTDNAGHSVSGVTDANGVYHLRIDGFVPPMIASVTRSDGTVWHSPSVNTPVTRGFITISISGLTDYLAFQVAQAAGKSSSSQLTPALLSSNLSALTTAKSNLNSQIQSQIIAAGLDPLTFDPVTYVLVTNHTSYDAVLDSFAVTNTPTTATQISPGYTLGGNITGLTGLSGLTLLNGSNSLSVAAGSASFTMLGKLATGASYSITVGAQPAGGTCTVSNGSGTLGTANVVNVSVTCTATQGGAATAAPISGSVTTLAGNAAGGFVNATSTAASFNSPRGVTVDASGNIYVPDTGNNAIRKVTAAGVVTTLAGSGTAGFVNATGTAASFNSPLGLAVDASGNVYVADCLNNAVRKIDPTGVVTTLAGSGTAGFVDSTGSGASFNCPVRLAVDVSGNVYVADLSNNAVRKVTAAGVVTTLAGSGTAGFVNGTGIGASFNGPRSVALDASGNLYVADTVNNAIRKVTSGGVVTTFAGSGAAGFVNATGTAASFNNPYCAAVDSSGNVYVADTLNNAIRKVTSLGVVTTLAGNATAGFGNFVGTAASFNNPYGVAVDTNGYVYVGDTLNNAIRVITP